MHRRCGTKRILSNCWVFLIPDIGRSKYSLTTEENQHLSPLKRTLPGLDEDPIICCLILLCSKKWGPSHQQNGEYGGFDFSKFAEYVRPRFPCLLTNYTSEFLLDCRLKDLDEFSFRHCALWCWPPAGFLRPPRRRTTLLLQQITHQTKLRANPLAVSGKTSIFPSLMDQELLVHFVY